MSKTKDLLRPKPRFTFVRQALQKVQSSVNRIHIYSLTNPIISIEGTVIKGILVKVGSTYGWQASHSLESENDYCYYNIMRKKYQEFIIPNHTILIPKSLLLRALN